MPDLVDGILATIAYGAVGTALMALGFVLIDLATPRKLRELIWVHGNRNAAVLLSSGLLGVGLIVTTAILVSETSLGARLLSTGIYGLIGLVLMSVAFVLVDFATPGRLGRLGAILSQSEPHPAVWVSAAVHLSISGIIAGAIT